MTAAVGALRPGGLVLITVPNFAWWQRRRFGNRWYHLDLPRHRVHLTPKGSEPHSDAQDSGRVADDLDEHGRPACDVQYGSSEDASSRAGSVSA